MLLCKGLPVEVEGRVEAGLAGSDATSMLMDLEAAEGFAPLGIQTVYWMGKSEFTGFIGSFVADAKVGWIGGREDVVGCLLCGEGGDDGEEEKEGVHGGVQFVVLVESG